MTLLQHMERQQLDDRERLRIQTRGQLEEVLRRTIPGQRVFLFGSILKTGRFSDESDIDVALESEPQGMTLYQLISLLGERMGRTRALSSGSEWHATPNEAAVLARQVCLSTPGSHLPVAVTAPTRPRD